MSFCSVTVNVCGWPTTFVAFGAIEIFAFTQRFIAGPEFGATPSVERVSVSPPTETVVDARTAQTPVTAEVSVIEQEPVPPAVVQLPRRRAAVDGEADGRAVRRVDLSPCRC